MLVHFEDRETPIIDVGHKQIIRRRVGYHVKDDRVSVVHSEHLTGTNIHSGKRWYRWQTIEGKTIKQNSRGFIYGSQWKPKSFLAIIPFSTMLTDTTFGSLVEDKFGEVKFENVYPMASHFGISNNHQVGGGVRPFLRTNNFAELTIAMFGKTRYTKELEAAVSSGAGLSTLAIARDFRGLVSDYQIIKFIHESAKSTQERFAGSIRPSLKLLDGASLDALIAEPITNSNYYYVFRPITTDPKPLTKIKSWLEFDRNK